MKKAHISNFGMMKGIKEGTFTEVRGSMSYTKQEVEDIKLHLLEYNH